MGDMPSANAVWGTYPRQKGFLRRVLPDTCPERYTVEDFAEDHREGVYILALSSRVVAVVDGVLLYCWEKDKEPNHIRLALIRFVQTIESTER